MTTFDRARASAKRGVARGRERIDFMRAQRRRTELLRELGEAYYAEHSGTATHEAVAGKLAALDTHAEELRKLSGRPDQTRRARDIMHPGTECVGENDSIATAAQKMRDLGVGSLPICGTDDQLHGIITDRDITVRCIAEGGNPREVTARDLAQDRLFWVEATADVSEVLRVMENHQVKRLPVIENRRLVGIISESDLARNLDDHRLAEFVERVYATS
jgi:CBS domain-containing protein